jgi:hypothetical protein
MSDSVKPVSSHSAVESPDATIRPTPSLIEARAMTDYAGMRDMHTACTELEALAHSISDKRSEHAFPGNAATYNRFLEAIQDPSTVTPGGLASAVGQYLSEISPMQAFTGDDYAR